MVTRRSFLFPPSRHILCLRRGPSLRRPPRRSRSRGHLHHLHRQYLHHFRQGDDDVNYTSAAAPKQKDTSKEEPVESSPLKPAPSASVKGAPSDSKSKGKRKASVDETKASNGAPPKKQELKSSVKEEAPPSTKSGSSQKGAPSSSSKCTSAQPSSNSSAPPSGSITEEEIRNVLMHNTLVTTYDLVSKFKWRLKTPDDKEAFAGILKKISKIQKSTGGPSYVVLREQ